MFNRTLKSFVPNTYKDIVEMDSILNSEEKLMDITRREMAAAFSNTFVVTSDEAGIAVFEGMLNILAKPQTETLEFRKQRVLNRMAMSPPFTFRFLKKKLDEIIGTGSWDAYIDFANYTLYVESSASDQNWYHELAFTVNKVKPCNMVFTNVPRSAHGVRLCEEITYEQKIWKYRLGSWKLSRSPFSEVGGRGIAKMANIPSVQPSLLNDTASFISSDISSVLINDAVEITNFRTNDASGNQVRLEYVVTPEMTDVITDIKLMRAGAILTQSSVYIPVTEPVISKHIITVKEGA